VFALVREINATKCSDEIQRLLPRKWTFAHPTSGPTFQLQEYWRTIGQAVKDRVARGCDDITTGAERVPMVAATMGCAGAGKSRLCDEAGDIFFHGTDVDLLKVTYNLVPLTSCDRVEPADAFMWRVVGSACGLTAVALVPMFVEAAMVTKSWTITRELMHALVDSRCKAANRVLVVDELMKLFTHLSDKGHMASVLSVCSAFVTQSRMCLITSFSPGPLASMSESGRPPIWLPQRLLAPDDSVRFLCDLMGIEQKALRPAHWDIIVQSGGHPRSLCKGASYFQRHGKTADAMALLDGIAATELSEDDIKHIVTASFRPTKIVDIQQDRVLLKHLRSGTLIFLSEQASGSDGGSPMGWIAVPAPMVAASVSTATDSSLLATCLQNVLKRSHHAPSKALESVCIGADELRCKLGLLVIPPNMEVTISQRRKSGRSIQRAHVNWDEVAFLPSTTDVWEHDSRSILNLDYTYAPETALTELKRNVAYVPSNCSHPAFEAMYFCTHNVIALHQQKINDDLRSAIGGLNRAARELGNYWEGEFLYIVVCMQAEEAKDLLQGAHHPVLFVNQDNAHWYFSPSLAPVAMSLLFKHLQDVGGMASQPFQLKSTPGRQRQRRNDAVFVAGGDDDGKGAEPGQLAANTAAPALVGLEGEGGEDRSGLENAFRQVSIEGTP
jgi:hypothetical protein